MNLQAYVSKLSIDEFLKIFTCEEGGLKKTFRGKKILTVSVSQATIET